MKPENFEKITKLMNERQAISNTLRRLMENRLTIAINYTNSIGNIMEVDAVQGSSQSEQCQAWAYIRDLKIRLGRSIENIDAKLLEL